MIYLCGKSTAILYDTDDKRKTGSAEEGVLDRVCMYKFGGASAKLKHALLCIRLSQIFGEPHLHRCRRLQHGDRTAAGGLSAEHRHLWHDHPQGRGHGRHFFRCRAAGHQLLQARCRRDHRHHAGISQGAVPGEAQLPELLPTLR